MEFCLGNLLMMKLSHSVRKEGGLGTTMDAVNATGILIADQDGTSHTKLE